MHQIAQICIKISKFYGGPCPRTPLELGCLKIAVYLIIYAVGWGYPLCVYVCVCVHVCVCVRLAVLHFDPVTSVSDSLLVYSVYSME